VGTARSGFALRYTGTPATRLKLAAQQMDSLRHSKRWEDRVESAPRWLGSSATGKMPEASKQRDQPFLVDHVCSQKLSIKWLALHPPRINGKEKKG
jgi:hypothetical protein